MSTSSTKRLRVAIIIPIHYIWFLSGRVGVLVLVRLVLRPYRLTNANLLLPSSGWLLLLLLPDRAHVRYSSVEKSATVVMFIRELYWELLVFFDLSFRSRFKKVWQNLLFEKK